MIKLELKRLGKEYCYQPKQVFNFGQMGANPNQNYGAKPTENFGTSGQSEIDLINKHYE